MYGPRESLRVMSDSQGQAHFGACYLDVVRGDVERPPTWCLADRLGDEDL